jgi:uncharacterized membrane protein
VRAVSGRALSIAQCAAAPSAALLWTTDRQPSLGRTVQDGLVVASDDIASAFRTSCESTLGRPIAAARDVSRQEAVMSRYGSLEGGGEENLTRRHTRASSSMGQASSLPSTVLTATSAVGSGMIGGLLFAFSSFIMPALSTLPAEASIAAMNSINKRIINPLFLTTFVGTAATSGAVLVTAAAKRSHPSAEPLRLAASCMYILGVFGVTVLVNVPLNDKLAKVVASPTVDRAVWNNYYRPWMAWNHVRAAAAVLASGLFTAALTR